MMRILVFGGLECLEGNPGLHDEHDWIRCVTDPPSQPFHLRYDLLDDTLEAILGRLPDAEPFWDVTMIGNFNHAVQRERAH